MILDNAALFVNSYTAIARLMVYIGIAAQSNRKLASA